MNEDTQELNYKTEIIAVASGKGGTGKTLFTASLGYALTNAGNNVLFIDADIGTDGLSLFLLGQENIKAIRSASEKSALIDILRNTESNAVAEYSALQVSRKDHGVEGTQIYQALISSRSLFGDDNYETTSLNNLQSNHTLDISKEEFSSALSSLFRAIRESQEFDYVIVDTRGGFAFQSIVTAALADSFIVVTEPDYTSFYQDRNLVKRIGDEAIRLEKESVLRAIVVNKATDGEEKDFRLALVNEFKTPYEDTYALPLDLEAVKAYKTQQLPFITAPSSQYAFHTINALSSIMNIVTAQWDRERIIKWNNEVSRIDSAISLHNEEMDKIDLKRKQDLESIEENKKLVKERALTIEHLRQQLLDKDNYHHSEISRSERELQNQISRNTEMKEEMSNVLSYSRATEENLRKELNKEREESERKYHKLESEYRLQRDHYEIELEAARDEISDIQKGTFSQRRKVTFFTVPLVFVLATTAVSLFYQYKNLNEVQGLKTSQYESDVSDLREQNEKLADEIKLLEEKLYMLNSEPKENNKSTNK